MGKHKKVNIGDRFGKLVVVKYNGVRKSHRDCPLDYIYANAIAEIIQLLRQTT